MAAANLFKVLSSPLRVGILLRLDERPHTVGELADVFGASQPLVSQHLKVLRQSCLVQADRHGREMSYRLMDDHVTHMVADAVAHAREHDPATPAQTHAPGKDAS
ncbi:ArsR/SmtB family transcription factor [Gephyromycinifex aptenodytis]|uniref:ArsR/SmtB family transcription factor n=1 Tax=Gephyromycinifex aptenodytis TaxID=2716227 RepID=UPI001D02FA67|nr:metalloregulator ArsR/SmtB family transcription factor [Gephyromycinifex aptenodytis]